MKLPNIATKKQRQLFDYGLNHPYSLLCADPRLGKTMVAIYLQKSRNVNTLIICPSYLILNWRREILKWSPKAQVTIFRKGKDIYEPCDSDFVVISFDLVQKAEHLFEWCDMAVIDECFHKDTLVETPDGPKKISEIKEGDVVNNFGGAGAVSRVFKRFVSRAIKITYNGKKITCSENHLFFTDRGWTPARLLKKGSIIYGDNEKMSSLRRSFYKRSSSEPISSIHPLLSLLLCEEDRGEDMQKLRERIFSKFLPESEGYMGDVFRGVCKGGSRSSIKGQSLASHPPNEGPHSSRKKEERGDREHQISGRQRENCPDRAGDDEDYAGFKVPVQLYREWSSVLQEYAKSLQTRLWTSTEKNSGGAGRAEPLWTEEAGRRHQKRRSFKEIRVESVEVQEYRSEERSEESCFYDIEVLGHPSYFVNGALVHNCHNLKNLSSKRSEFIHRALYENSVKYFHGLTGTPLKNRVREFYSILALASYDPKGSTDFLDAYPDEITFAEKFSHRLEYEVKVKTKRGQEFRMPVVKYEGLKNVDELKRWLKGKYIRIRADIGDLPPISYKDILISDSPNQKLLAAFNSFFDGEDSHLVRPDIKVQAAMQKVPFTIKYVENLVETVDCCLIYSDHKEPVKAIAAHFGVPAITGAMPANQRAQLVADFQAGRLKFICATIGSLKEGADLFRSKDIVLNDPCWIPGDLNQVMNRIRAIGEKDPRTVHRVMGSPQDSTIYEALEKKSEVIRMAGG